ncbi:MAG: hypothetical protein KUG75_11490 [Pseudomonadales bacterium]|nr:hypothetical protein [Pseudomonadales bacterium]
MISSPFSKTVALLICACTFPAWSSPVICTQLELSRSVEVIYADPDLALPCEVLYDKRDEGSQSILWRAENTPGFCEEKADQLVRTLHDSGWACSSREESEANAASAQEDTTAIVTETAN